MTIHFFLFLTLYQNLTLFHRQPSEHFLVKSHHYLFFRINLTQILSYPRVLFYLQVVLPCVSFVVLVLLDGEVWVGPTDTICDIHYCTQLFLYFCNPGST